MRSHDLQERKRGEKEPTSQTTQQGRRGLRQARLLRIQDCPARRFAEVARARRRVGGVDPRRNLHSKTLSNNDGRREEMKSCNKAGEGEEKKRPHTNRGGGGDNVCQQEGSGEEKTGMNGAFSPASLRLAPAPAPWATPAGAIACPRPRSLRHPRLPHRHPLYPPLRQPLVPQGASCGPLWAAVSSRAP